LGFGNGNGNGSAAAVDDDDDDDDGDGDEEKADDAQGAKWSSTSTMTRRYFLGLRTSSASSSSPLAAAAPAADEDEDEDTCGMDDEDDDTPASVRLAGTVASTSSSSLSPSVKSIVSPLVGRGRFVLVVDCWRSGGVHFSSFSPPAAAAAAAAVAAAAAATAANEDDDEDEDEEGDKDEAATSAAAAGDLQNAARQWAANPRLAGDSPTVLNASVVANTRKTSKQFARASFSTKARRDSAAATPCLRLTMAYSSSRSLAGGPSMFMFNCDPWDRRPWSSSPKSPTNHSLAGLVYEGYGALVSHFCRSLIQASGPVEGRNHSGVFQKEASAEHMALEQLRELYVNFDY